MLNKAKIQILNAHFHNLHLSHLQSFHGIVNGTSQNKQPFQGRRISCMPKTIMHSVEINARPYGSLFFGFFC
jgi:hypothetical protein